jgi:hypothetical protein
MEQILSARKSRESTDRAAHRVAAGFRSDGGGYDWEEKRRPEHTPPPSCGTGRPPAEAYPPSP